MQQLLYVSNANVPVTADVIREILVTARRSNRALGVTGLLMHAEDMYIQILEGEAKTLDALTRRIGRDRRHRSLMVLVQRDIRARSFPDWSMACRELDVSLPEEDAVCRFSREAVLQRSGAGAAAILDIACSFGGARLSPRKVPVRLH